MSTLSNSCLLLLDLSRGVIDACAMSKKEQTFVFGAGLAGLCAAFRLKRRYRLLERSAKSGGLCETVEENGFRFDRTGHLLHLREGRIRRLVLGLLDEEPLDIERNSRIFSNGVYTHYPFQANTYGLPLEVVADCLNGFIESVEKRGAFRTEPATFEEFIYRNFGDGIARHFMIPYNAKLWGVHPRDITADWCTRFVPKPSVREVIDGAIGLPPKRVGYNANFLYPKTGIEELPAAFARKVGPIEYGTSPQAVDYRRKRVLVGGEWFPFRSVVSTIPLKNLIGLLVDPPKRMVRYGEQLSCSSLRYLDVALDRPAGTEYHWTYVPENKYPFYRVGCYSHFSQTMAPPGKSTLYVELSSRGPIRLSKIGPSVAQGLIDMGVIHRASDISVHAAQISALCICRI